MTCCVDVGDLLHGATHAISRAASVFDRWASGGGSAVVTMVAATLTSLFVVAFGVYGLPATLRRLTSGQRLLEARPGGYAMRDVRAYLRSLKPGGLDILRSELRHDIAFAVSYGVGLSAVVAGTFNRALVPMGAIGWVAVAVPIAAAAADVGEDVALLRVRADFANDHIVNREVDVRVASWMTIVKLLFLLVTAELVVLGTMALVLGGDGALPAPVGSFVAGLTVYLVIYGLAAPWLPSISRGLLHMVTLMALFAVADIHGLVGALGLRSPVDTSWMWEVLALVVALAALVAACVALGKVPASLMGGWAGRTTRAFWFEIGPRLLVTTVLLEEVAFRGLLFGGARELLSGFWCPAMLSAVAFGVWHVSPTILTMRRQGRAPSIRIVGATVAFTAVAGLILTSLRSASRSLWVPIAVHYAVNAAMLAAGFAAVRMANAAE